MKIVERLPKLKISAPHRLVRFQLICRVVDRFTKKAILPMQRTFRTI